MILYVEVPFFGDLQGMWRSLAVSVTLLPMLFHSILGCCWHHAHSAWHIDCGLTAVPFEFDSRQSPIPNHSCGHHQEALDSLTTRNDTPVSQWPQPTSPSHPCDEESCVYVARKAVAFAVFQISVWTPLALCITPRPEGISCRTVGRIACVRQQKAGTQLRALTQVWLV